MAWYDDIISSATSIFSSEQAPPEEQIAPSPYSPSMMLSTHYSLASLVATTKALSQPNLPKTESEIQNLSMTADTLEYLESKIGPFTILSGFRSPELQAVLAASGDPVASGKSYHELGLAVDIYPTTMSFADYFGRILADEEVRSHFIEIAIKPAQNSLHLAVKSPYDLRDPKIMGLNTEDQYARLNAEDIARYIEPFVGSAQEAYDYAEAKLVTYNRTPLILAAVAALGGAAFLIFTSMKKKA